MKKLIVWEKWADPFEEKSQIDESHIEEDDYEKPSYEQMNPIKLIMGPISTNQININDSQSFNFWIAHTNFNITNNIETLIEKTDGVEVLDILTRYRFRVGIGKIFKDREVMKSINDNIYGYINDNN